MCLQLCLIVTWLVPCETAAVLPLVLCIQYNHAPVYSVTIQYQNKISTERWRRKLSCQDSNPRSFNRESITLPLSYPTFYFSLNFGTVKPCNLSSFGVSPHIHLHLVDLGCCSKWLRPHQRTSLIPSLWSRRRWCPTTRISRPLVRIVFSVGSSLCCCGYQGV